MVDFQVRCTLRSQNGVPADDCVNTFAVIADDLASMSDMTQGFVNFYNGIPVGAPYGLSAYINDTMLRTDGLLIEWIDSPQTPPNPPLYSEVHDLLPVNSTSPMPQEVAICSSFFADGYLTSPNPGRLRGRIYFGPLTVLASSDSGTNAVARPSDNVGEALVTNSEGLANFLAANQAQLAVWSRVAGAFTPVVGGWVDNEFDTQRRRGRPSTARALWTL